MTTAAILRDAKAAASNRKGGVLTARVESTADPERMGRVRVRIFQIHGDESQTTTEALPWAEIADNGGGGFDYGSAGRLYPIGSVVWVMFENEDEDFPVVMGGRRGKLARNEGNSHEFLTLRGQTESGEKPWLPLEGNEIPKDVFADTVDGDNNPTRSVWQKSFKGHTILVEDRDGHEFLRIIDRAGQVIEMDCPVTVTANANNAEQRGSRNAIEETQVSTDSMVNGRGYIRLKDVAGQEIMMDGAASNEEIRITSRNRQGTSIQQLILSSKKGQERIEISDKQGNKFLLDPNGATPITISDASGNMIQFDSDSGLFKTTAVGKSEEVVGSSKTFTSGGSLTSTIGGNDESKVIGNHLMDVMNDMAVSVSGMLSYVIGSAMSIQVNNTGPNGPKDQGLKVDVITGDMELTNRSGDMRITTMLGDVEFLTTSGKGKLHTDVGDVEVSTTSGNAKLHTDSGNIDVSTSSGNLEVKTSAGTATLGSESLTTDIKGPLGVNVGGNSFSLAYGEGVNNVIQVIVGMLTAPGAFISPMGPCTPGAIAALPGALAALTTPGTLYSLFHKVG